MKNKKVFGGVSRREFLSLGGAALAGMSLAGIPRIGYGAEKKPKYGGVLRVGLRYGSRGLDAHKNQEFADYLIYCLMYGGLTEQGKLPQVEIYPMLAKSWEISRDGKEYLFSLREGIKFHHGKELESGDVRYSIDRVMNPATRAAKAFAFKWIDSVKEIDKYHVKISLKEAFAPFLSSLTIGTCPIIPAGWEPTGTKPAPGTGPYTFKSFVPNETIELARFDQYWEFDQSTGDRLPYLNGVYMKKMVDEAVRWAALRAGDIDMLDTPPLNVMAKAVLEEPVPGIFMDYESVGNMWLWFNLSKPPFDNKKVRQAIAYALDKKKIAQAVFWGLGETLNNQPFLELSRFYIPTQDREVNLAKAKQLLAEAGYPSGFKVEFLVFSLSYDLAGCETTLGQLREIGIQATMKVVDRAAYYPMVRKGDYSISYRGDSERFDWDEAFYMYLHSSEIDKNNFSRYSNKEVDALLEKGRITMNLEERREIYKKVIEIVKDDVPIFYVGKPVVGVAFRDHLKGYRKGFTMRFAWSGGGTKYWWLEK